MPKPDKSKKRKRQPPTLITDSDEEEDTRDIPYQSAPESNRDAVSGSASKLRYIELPSISDLIRPKAKVRPGQPPAAVRTSSSKATTSGETTKGTERRAEVNQYKEELHQKCRELAAAGQEIAGLMAERSKLREQLEAKDIELAVVHDIVSKEVQRLIDRARADQPRDEETRRRRSR